MSSGNDSKQPPVPPAGQQEPYFPPPPPGPPPGQAEVPMGAQPGTQAQPLPAQQTQQPLRHSNEAPIPDYDIPSYDPAHPHYAPPPKQDDAYHVTPTDEQPPPFPPRPTSSGKQKHDGASKTNWGEKLAGWGSKAAAPFNALAARMGSETFLPTTMDKECEKAARILRSFAKDGIYSDAAPQHPPAQSTVLAATGAPQSGDAPVAQQQTEAVKGKKPRVLLTIPSKVISRAQGLAIFTTARVGFQVSGATGSGILVARLPDGSWSPPSGIQVHSVGAGFMIGVDIYDCVIVINTREALDTFTRTRMSLGSDLAIAAGPWGAGGALDFGMPQSRKGKEKELSEESLPDKVETGETPARPEVTSGPETGPVPAVSTPGTASQDGSAPTKAKPSAFREAMKHPVYSYVKSRGFYGGVQVDGTVITERKEANAAFYGAPVSVEKIIRGEVPREGPPGMWPVGAKALFEVLKGAEGWRGQQGQSYQPHAATSSVSPAGLSSTVPSVTADMQVLNHGGSGQPGTSIASGGGPAPPPSSTSAADWKAAEAAAEAAAQQQQYDTAPPTYTSPTNADLPPAYVDDGQVRPPPDSKS